VPGFGEEIGPLVVITPPQQKEVLSARQKKKRNQKKKKAESAPLPSITKAPTDDEEPDDDDPDDKAKKDDAPKLPVCRFHKGRRNHKQKVSPSRPASEPALSTQKWLCCDQALSNKGCVGYRIHTPSPDPSPLVLVCQWQFLETPPVHPDNRKTVRHAVALDCEMGINTNYDSELIRVSLIDYMTKEVLVDRLIRPPNLLHANTQYSGVTRKQLEDALESGVGFDHRGPALIEIWTFVGPNTVVVGHDLHNDFNALRWIHSNVVDTYVLEKQSLKAEEQRKAAQEWKDKHAENPQVESSNAGASMTDLGLGLQRMSLGVGDAGKPEQSNAQKEPAQPKAKGSGPLSLKSAVMARLGREIRKYDMHDSIEDAIAARDVAEWHANFRVHGMDGRYM
jgi:hypothetical protein